MKTRRAVGIKNVTANEPFFQGHFPGHPVMPGVLIIEAMAQVGGIFAMITDNIGDDKVTYFAGIDNARFRKPVVPGDTLRFELTLTNCRRGLYCFNAKAYVESTLVAEADLKRSRSSVTEAQKQALMRRLLSPEARQRLYYI